MNVLAISFPFPPMALPRSIQVARLLSGLGSAVTLICAETDAIKLDGTIYPDAEREIEKLVRVKFTAPLLGKQFGRVLYRLSRKRWNERYRNPDQYRSWSTPVLETVTGLLEIEKPRFDCIVTFGQPFTCHMIGLELKRRLNLPWVAYFSDPWIENQFNEYDPHARELNLRSESLVLQQADMVLMNSRETIDLVFSKYPVELKDKARVLPHAFDEELFKEVSSPASGRLLIRHIGEFYGPRTPYPVLRALLHGRKVDSTRYEDVTFEFIGPYDLGPELDEILSNPLLPDVRFGGRISYLESLAAMGQSDGLLLIDAPSEQSVFLPSKLIDYIGSGKPICGITPPGTANSLIREIGGLAADPMDIESIEKVLADFVDQVRERKHSADRLPWGRPDVRSRFARAAVQSQFSRYLVECVRSSGREVEPDAV